MLAKGFGGGERLFVDLVTILAKTGNDVLAICQPGSEAEGRLRNDSNIEIDTVRVFNTGDPFAWRSIASKIQNHDSDLVQSHLSRATFLAGKACKKLNKPLVVTLHNYVDLKYYRNVTKFIPATRNQFEYLCHKGISENKIELIPHFSHIDPVTVPSFNENDTLVFGCYGRMVDKKGFHIMLDAFDMFMKTGNKARLIMGGDGPKLENLKSQCEVLGISKHVQFVGWIKDAESFLKTIDIFVLPSLDEPFGIVVLEAMAMAKPIVSTKSQGPGEILNDENAYLSEINDIGSIVQAMTRAFDDKEKREKKARQALTDYKTFYAKDVVVPKFLQLYRQVVAETQNAR